MSKPASFALAALLVLAMSPPVRATDDVAVKTLLTGLKNPCGIAIRPGESAEAYEIFVADSGAARIVLVNSDAKDASHVDVITGFSLAKLRDTGLSVGPVGMQFLDRKRLVVGASGDDGAALHLFELDEVGVSLAADSRKQQVGVTSDSVNLNHVYAIARTHANEAVRDALVMSCFGNAESGDVRTVALRAATLTEVTLLTASKSNSKESSPAAITVSESGHVVVGWVGNLRQPRDSKLTFYNPASGAELLELSTELHDIVALTYSPRTGNLYAADAAWMERTNGGVYRIDAATEAGESKCSAAKVAAVVHPSAMAFGPDGALYVTAFGDSDGAESTGMLLRITGDL